MAPAPALAALPSPESARTYVAARAASMAGDSARSARLLGALADANTSDTSIARQALGEAIAAGDMSLAVRLARRIPHASLAVEGRLLLAADEIRSGRAERAVLFLAGGTAEEANLQFVEPVLQAWTAADRGDLQRALSLIEKIPPNSVLAPYRDEHRAFLYLKFRRTAEAEPFARRAIGTGGGRESRLRLALADGFLAAGDRDRALAMIEGMGTETGAARQRVMAGRQSGLAIDGTGTAFAELLLGLGVDLNRLNSKALPIAMIQIARYADPGNSAAAVLLALLLDARGRSDEGLRVLSAVPADDPLAVQARDTAARILGDAKRHDEALALAQGAVAGRSAGVGDFARLGDVLARMKRYDQSAEAYGRALALASAQGLKTELWTLHMLRATALESGDRWPEARAALQAALAIAPEQPLILNFLGYAKLERGEDLDVAEAMIRKASALAPDDASITDSLGWALYKRGRLNDAISTLQRAARSDPQQAEIHEHLGDALYKAGRRFEARFAWNAALITAEDEMAGRVRAKIETGLSPATAAP